MDWTHNRNLIGLVMLGCFTFSGCQGGSASGPWVARVNGESITVDQFEHALNATTHLPGRDFSTASKKTNFLNEMIREELLFQAAWNEDFIRQSKDLKRAMAKAYLQDFMEKNYTPPSEEALKAYFNKYRDDMELVRVAHILIKPKDPKSETSRAEARTKAEQLLRELKADPSAQAFKEMAQKHSQDLANAKDGGDLGWFNRKRMVPSFSKASFALTDIGALSDVVETQFGFHLIRLIDAKRGLDKFQEEIQERLTQESRRAMAEAMLKKLESQASIRINHDTLQEAKVRQRPNPLP